MKVRTPTSFLLLLLCWQLTAQNPARSGKDYALFFVVQDFDHWIDFSDKSVQQVKDIETELQENYGFRTEFIFNPTRQEVLDKLDNYAARKFSDYDQLLVYISMHGHYEEGSTGALIPKDGLKDDPFQDSWIRHPLLEDLVNQVPCRHITLAMDACYSGTFEGSKGRPNQQDWEVLSDCASKEANALRYQSRLYLTSGGVERTPINSQFADKWLEALRVRNTDGVMSHNDLVGVLEDANPIPRYGEFKGHEKGGNFVFVHIDNCTTQARKGPADPKADIKAWQLAKQANTVQAYRRYVSLFPNGEFRPVAKQRIAEIEVEQQEFEDWRKAKKANSIKVYKDFLRRYPNSIYREIAEHNLATIAPNHHDNGPRLKFVKGGSFKMGSIRKSSNEKPVHRVTLDDYYIGAFEVTFDEYDAFCNSTGASKPDDNGWGRGKRPVISVSWFDAVNYCNWRSEQDGLEKFYNVFESIVSANWDANGYRLPTEAEWEYAARSKGKGDKWAGTSNEKILDKYANGKGSDGFEYTSPVGSLLPNELGLFDMSGNVAEWCWDWDGSYPSNSQTNPRGPDSDSRRVQRGGSWNKRAYYLRCTDRDGNEPNEKSAYIGFRLAKSKR